MLGLFSKSPQHPLADAREAKRIFGELATREARSAIEEASGWLEGLITAEGFKLEQRLGLMFQIDEAVAAQARRLGREYLNAGTTNRMLELKLFSINSDFWQQVIDAYLNCMVRYRSGEKDAAAIRSYLPQLYGRLIRALGVKLKWDQFRYGPQKGEFWSLLGGVYLSAVEGHCETKPRVLYPGGRETTLEAEYLKIMIFQSSSMSKLTPVEMEISDRFIDYFLPCFSLVREVRADNIYWVDAGLPVPPTRLAKVPEMSPSLRFFSGTRALEAIAQTEAQIRAEGRVPTNIHLGAVYEPEVVLPVLEHLAMYWSPKPPMRSSPRHKMESQLKVVNGLDAAFDKVKVMQDLDDLMDLGGIATEMWTVEDVSLGGMSATLKLSHNDWVRIGALIGMQPDGGQNWLIGLIRRYLRHGANEGAVGIETISKTPLGVEADSAGQQYNCILLDALEVGENARMLVPPGATDAKEPFFFSLNDRQVRVHPVHTLEKGNDYFLVDFMVQSYD